MQPEIPLTRDLVLIGGGHAHALALRMWGMKPLPGVRLTLINPGPTAPYSGMLPGHIAGHYPRDALDIDLVKLARFAGARLILRPATGIDPEAKRIEIAGRAPIFYDVASIDVGIHAEMPSIDGFSDHGLGAKPLDGYAAGWRAFVARVQAGEAAPQIAVIGGGVAGTELSLAMAHRLRGLGAAPEITLIEAGPTLSGFKPMALTKVRAALDRFGVTLKTNAHVARVGPDLVTLEDGEDIPAALTVGAAGAFAHGWLANSPLPLTADGFVRVGADLRVEGQDDLFAVGDCAHLVSNPRPKAGVYAVRAAPVLADNLAARLASGKTKPFKPQSDFLKLVSLGEKSALAEKLGVAVAGPLLWRWKNRIDQTFMDKFRDLPTMPAPALPPRLADGVRSELGHEAQMLCAGCGSKVAPSALSHTLSRLASAGRDDVLMGPGDDAALLAMGETRQVLTTDHLRAFTEDPQTFARIAALHALGDIWAMGASPQAALAQITVPRQSEALQARVLDELLTAAAEVFAEAGAEIVGGHTTMGAETVLGFTVTGLLDRPAILVDGAKPGDVLVLTRPIGSGTIFAAEMRGQAEGRDVAALLEVLSRSQGGVAAALGKAHAMTDVTGFGLAGHLMAIARASGVAATLRLEDVPLFDGAEALAEAGVRSTIYPANADHAPVSGMGETGRVALLHDPQTAGGFLAALDPNDVEAAREAVVAAGGRLWEIGSVKAGAPKITLV
ncbi:MAG TPA: selenide, water dikinase SelD [Maritimibacter sp.]|nr:selenide, water dikinase SelD [Maritimibacter sp.]